MRGLTGHQDIVSQDLLGIYLSPLHSVTLIMFKVHSTKITHLEVITWLWPPGPWLSPEVCSTDIIACMCNQTRRVTP